MSVTDTQTPTLDEQVVRDTIADLFMIATTGEIPTTWTDEVRENAQRLMEVWEDVLIELMAAA